MKKYSFSILFLSTIYLLNAQTATQPSNFSTSSGLSGDPYFISSLDNLYWLSQTPAEWDKYYKQTVDIEASTTNTWDSGAGFSPIGNSTTNFTGSYDGDTNANSSYTINGLTINRGATIHVGLFGYINNSNSKIEHLGVTNINITGANYTGGIVGNSNTMYWLDDCYSTGSVTGNGDYIGGLIGASREGAVTGCYSTASVSGANYIGGLLGHNKSNNVVTRCYSTGTVLGSGEFLGGLIGFNEVATVVKSYSTGSVSGSVSSVGGLIGKNTGHTLENCYSRSDVTRSSGTNSSFGAFCGYNDDEIEYCYATGKVIYIGMQNPSDKGFVAENSGGVYKNNFFDSELSEQTSGTGATSKTTAEMKDVATFTDYTDGSDGLDTPVWDFETDPHDDAATSDYWDLDMSVPKVSATSAPMAINDNYPFLEWENGYDTALPVELSSFAVKVTNQGVLCEWTTESEIENLGFILKRRTTYTDWLDIASYKTDGGLLGQGTTSSYNDYEYLDMLVQPNTTYDYRLADVDYDGVVTYHSVRTVTVENTIQSSLIEEFTVLPAYPNPFNPSTTITYGIETDNKVIINIYDITGQLINTLQNGYQIQGWYSVIWNGTNQQNKQVPAGIYLSKITSGDEVKTTKLMLLK